jgi:D-alanyl-D-alanine carboxypeptidase (penicillin-binding protein 5/6)
MRRPNKFISPVLLLFVLFIFCLPAQAQEPQIKAQSAVLIDAQNGQILYDKEASLPLPPASCGKIITAITALEMADTQLLCTVSQSASAVGESSIHIHAGDVFTLHDLLKGALIKSGNDACFAIAENMAGSEPFFVYWLNMKSLAIGAFSANLKNTNGLPQEGHVISAYDLALVARYAMRDQRFAAIVQMKTASIGSGDTARSLKNTNKLLWQSDEVTGIKTGTTDAAGACLVASLERDGRQLIAVVFHSPDRYGEALKLLQYGADNTKASLLAEKGEIIAAIPIKKCKNKLLSVVAASDLYYCYEESAGQGLHMQWQIEKNLQAPIEKYALVGQVMVVDKNNNIVAKSDLLAAEKIEKKGFF